jgi:serine/threonine protein kinase/cytochrome c-type biogenesis protein CcmH/NrfG
MAEFYGVQKGTYANDSTMIRAIRICRKCGAKIFSDAPEGLCAKCVLRVALGNFPDASVTGVDDPDRVDEPSRDAAPRVKTTARALELLGQLGDYELLEEVGRGGQGVVFRARQKSLNRTVALKVISLGQWASKAHLKRFRLEAEAAARLEHPGIVPIHEVGERDGSCYFSMGFVEGGQLDEVVRRTPMSIRQAAELIAKVARTVHYAHEHGIVHRDIKPGNILLDQKGEPHLTDFGLARLVESESSVTHTLEVLGTPSYMAPEQAVGNNAAVSSVTDVYGLGAVLYQLLTGQPPFAGGTTYETIKLLLDTEPRQPRLLNPKVDRDLSTICLKCLEKDPKRRYSSALALAQDLEHWLKHEPILARHAGIFTRGKKWVRRNPTSALLVASLVALAAAAGWIVWKSELIRQPLATGIAVLPFENLSEQKEDSAFADGVQDDILTKLARIADLKVISRTSVMDYRGKRNVRQIGNDLRVSHVLEGSIRRTGTHLRLNAQLINARTDTHVWAEQYDRDLNDLFAIQAEIAQKVAGQLHAKIAPAEKLTIERKPTNNSAAYDAYLRGRAFTGGSALDRSTLEGAAIRSYQEAVKLDPNFVLAWAYLSCEQSRSYWMGRIDQSPAELAAAKNSLDHALALDPNLPETHLALGYYRYYGEGDFTGALAEFQQAEKSLPNGVDAILAIALSQRRVGHWDEAIDGFRRAIELDPRNLDCSHTLAVTYICLRRFPEAIATADRVLVFEPTNRGALSGKVWALWATGDLKSVEPLLANPGVDSFMRGTQALFQRRYAAAIEIVSSALAAETKPDVRSDDEKLLLGLSQQRAGDVAAARATYQNLARDFQRKLEKVAPGSFAGAWLHADLGQAYAGLGEAASAVAEGQKAMAIYPSSKDPFQGPDEEEIMARIYALLGDADHAIPMLIRLLQTPYSFPITPALLRLDPVWDPLRSDPAFQQLCEEKQD